MLIVKDLIILIAKILIFIGDITLGIFTFFWRIFKLIVKLFKLVWQKILFLPRKFGEVKPRINEKEIFTAGPTLKFRKFSLPKFSLPRIKPPAVHFPKIKVPLLPQISLPILKFPKIQLRLPHLPRLNLRTKQSTRRRFLTIIPFRTKFKYLFIGSLLSLIFVFLPLWGWLFVQSLPNPRELTMAEVAQTTKIYDRNNILLYQIYANQNRTLVPLSRVPKNLKNATIAIEDKNFYKTPGVDLMAITRSALANFSGKPLQGGSTITQQLVKTRLLTPQRSVSRKIKEIVLSIWAQRIYTKDQILEMYFNQVPYGGTAWGVEAASQTYFGKSAKDLDLAQSAFLAGLPQAPSIYSPYGQFPNSWKDRQKEVLSRMVELGFISEKEKVKAEKEKLTFRAPQQILHAPHFVMFVKELLVDKYGLAMVERGGLNVVTTLDLKTQDFAQKVISEEVENSGYLNFSNAGALVTNPKNGDIMAMVGGKDYYEEKGGNYNVTTALRQPGSTIKVVTYSAALMNGYTAATTILDTPVSYKQIGSPPYSPVNYDGKFHGPVSLRNALGNSINVPAVKTLNQIGIKTMIDLAKNMGISTWGEPQNYGLAITLGAAEVKMTDMAVLYGTFANQGKKVNLNPIIKVTNYEGAILEEKNEVRKTQVLTPDIAFIISNILSDNRARALEFGVNSPLNIPGHTVSVKTGTTDSKRDNWTIGYSPNLLTAVWVGNNDNSPMNPILASGITGAAPIWNKIMTSLLRGEKQKDEIMLPPVNIVTKSCNGRSEYFVRGTENQNFCRSLSINGERPTINP